MKIENQKIEKKNEKVTHGIIRKEIERSREAKCNKAIVQILGTVLQVVEIRKRIITENKASKSTIKKVSAKHTRDCFIPPISSPH